MNFFKVGFITNILKKEHVFHYHHRKATLRKLNRLLVPEEPSPIVPRFHLCKTTLPRNYQFNLERKLSNLIKTDYSTVLRVCMQHLFPLVIYSNLKIEFPDLYVLQLSINSRTVAKVLLTQGKHSVTY